MERTFQKVVAMLSDLKFLNAFATGLIEKFTADIPESQWCHALPGLPNHPAWQIGHLTMVRTMLITNYAGVPAVAAGTFDLYRGGSSPVPDPKLYPSKHAALETFFATQPHIVRLIDTVTEEVLNSPTPENFRARFPLVRNMFHALLSAHESLHIGQIASWRSAMKMPRIL